MEHLGQQSNNYYQAIGSFCHSGNHGDNFESVNLLYVHNLHIYLMFSYRMIDWVFFTILPLFHLRMVTGGWPGNKTFWHSCPAYCNCSFIDYTAMAKCDLQMMDKCENFVLPNNIMML